MSPSFDPIVFLGITNVAEAEKNRLTEKLMEQISRYLAARLLELLPEDQTDNIHDYSALLEIAQKTIPNIDKKVAGFLEDFRAEFNKNL